MQKYFLLFLFFISGNTLAQDKWEAMDTFLRNSYQRHQFNGMVIIAKSDTVLFQKNYGFADIPKQKKFTPKSTFQIASVSKQFTAFGIMLLHEKGKLNYDDFVVQYIPAFPYPAITIRHLLWHISGMPGFWTKIRPKLDPTVSNGNKELLQFLIDSKMPLDSIPGTKYEYADIGYDFLAMIIESVSKQTYQEFLQRNIFKPLKMKQTHALMVTDIRKIKNKHLVMGHSYLADSNKYVYSHLEKKHDFVFYLGNFYGDGSVISSAADLLKWNRAIRHHLLIKKSSWEEAFQSAKDKHGNIIYVNKQNKLNPTYGFGWALATQDVLGKMISHTGGHPGFSTYLLFCKDTNISVVFLSNQNNADGVGSVRVKMLDMVIQLFK